MLKVQQRISNRCWLLAVVTGLAVASSFAAARAADWPRDDAAHLLRRAGFSGTPEEVDRLHALGESAAVEYLLTGQLPKDAAAPLSKVELPALQLEAPATAPAKAAKKAGALVPVRDWWVDRMIRTDRPLEEKMTLFWHGLFTSGVREVKSADQMTQQNQLFHTYALGNYKALAHEILHDPAMLKYLNNNQNLRGRPNENLARELCELFTMGEGHGYTEKDVAEIARALTGATVRGGAKNPQGEYAFLPGSHDATPKTIFGKTGNFKPDDVIDLIFEKPEPAIYLARKLWEFYAGPNPTDVEIAPVAAALRDHHYEVAPALRVLFLSPAFYSDKAKFSVIKSPTDQVVDTIRELDISMTTPQQLSAACAAIGACGQTLFEPPNVRGWPGGEDWITAATLYARYNTSASLVDGALLPANQGAKAANKPVTEPRRITVAAQPAKLFAALGATPTSEKLLDAAVARFLQRPLHPSKRQVLLESLGDAPLKLGTAETDARVRQMLALLLSTPEYQVE